MSAPATALHEAMNETDSGASKKCTNLDECQSWVGQAEMKKDSFGQVLAERHCRRGTISRCRRAPSTSARQAAFLWRPRLRTPQPPVG
jgi:hypothetical protein